MLKVLNYEKSLEKSTGLSRWSIAGQGLCLFDLKY